MKPLVTATRGLFRLWRVLRELAGETAYDTHIAGCGAGQEPPPTRAEFYLDSLRRKYESVNRCC